MLTRRENTRQSQAGPCSWQPIGRSVEPRGTWFWHVVVLFCGVFSYGYFIINDFKKIGEWYRPLWGILRRHGCGSRGSSWECEGMGSSPQWCPLVFKCFPSITPSHNTLCEYLEFFKKTYFILLEFKIKLDTKCRGITSRPLAISWTRVSSRNFINIPIHNMLVISPLRMTTGRVRDGSSLSQPRPVY